MPATPNGNGDDRHRPEYDPIEGGSDVAQQRHKEIMSVHREMARSSTAIKWATWVYAAAAIAMLLWSVFMFVLS